MTVFMVPLALKRSPVVGRFIQLAIEAEEWLYDHWHNVDTGMRGVEQRRGQQYFYYQPTRPGRMRVILRALPVADYAKYIFIDVGSGKGRVLLLAAEFPFRAVIGLEHDPALHQQALTNLSQTKRVTRRTPRVESLCLDATEYSFPDFPLVLYLFNPFGAETMSQLMRNLNASLEENPRDVLIAMFNPESAFVLDAMPEFELSNRNPAFLIYRYRDQVELEKSRSTTA